MLNIDKFRILIRDIQGQINEAKVIVGISGGADSIFIFHLLLESIDHKNIIVAHINHMLRDSADAEQKFVENLCNKYGVIFESKGVDISKYAKQKKIGIEECGRHFRYEFFDELREKYKAKYILTAHHADDLSETIIFNILRGSYIHGLVGIKRIDDNNFFRPLLSLSKEDIISALRKNNIKWMEDESNFDCSYDRNFIRHKIIGSLKKESEEFLENIKMLSKSAENISQFLKLEASKLIDKKSNSINVNKFKKSEEFLQLETIICLYEYYYGDRKDITYSWLKELNKFILNSVSGTKKEFGRKYWLKKDFDFITVVDSIRLGHKDKLLDKIIKVGDKIRWGDFEIELANNKTTIDFNDGNCYFCYLDKAKIGATLHIRSFNSGDHIYKHGLDGSKSLKKWFIENKIPVDKRSQYPVITIDKGEIITLAGRCNNDKYINKELEENLILRISNQNNYDQEEEK